MWLRFPRATDALRVTKAPGTPDGAWYIPQQLTGVAEEWILWFRDGLVAGETIEIAAR